MKTKKIISTLSVCTLLLLTISCSKESSDSPRTNPEASSINEYILNLQYSADELLNVQDTGGAPSERTLTNEFDEVLSPNQGTIFSCNVKEYDLESNFDDVAILRPTNGIIFPGALVVGNQGMLDGSPDPFSISRAPATLRLDLPGIGEQGTMVVDNPENSSVQTHLDQALEWWNDNAYQEGYVNAANSSYQAANSYSSTQLGLDVGLNLEWATGNLAAQLQYETNTERRVASMVFKQVFYTVTMNTPLSPASVFGDNVSLNQIESIMNSSSPPAYVSSVAYGRIIMLRMESTNMDTSIDLDAVLEYASGVSGVGTVNVDYDAVLSNSSVNLITIGGNAEVAASAVDLADINKGSGALNHIITGENAIYSRNNPGVAIGYTIRYLKDNSLAKMGYTTDYTVEECQSNPFNHDEVTVTNDSFHDTRFRFRYKAQNSSITYNSPNYEINQGDVISRFPPSGAHDVEVIFEYQYGAGGWNFVEDYDLNYLYSERCYRFYGGNILGEPSEVQNITCN